MINGKTILAIIPARGGSKGIPRKNIKMLAGKPLIAWTIEEAKKSKYIDRLILSSEDDEIIQVAKEWGCEVPFIRPKELAADDTPGIEPVLHAINTLDEKYDYVCLLQPTSPLRKVADIDECIEKCIHNNAESCVSITEVDKHPFWTYEIDNEEKLKQIFDNKNLNRRQDMPKTYALNGAIYFSAITNLKNIHKFVDNNTIGFQMEIESSIDIDTILDFEIAEVLVNKLKNYDN
jgi:N-acylneuraminate cytidylyltransferase